jgi:hypothetical protein
MSPVTRTIPRFKLEVGMKRMIDRFEQLWCRSMHAQAMWAGIGARFAFASTRSHLNQPRSTPLRLE